MKLRMCCIPALPAHPSLLFFPPQDSDRLWRLTPPAQKALGALLDDSSAAMSFEWSILRNAPPLSPHGSPMCQATHTFPLAPLTREHLVDILQVWALWGLLGFGGKWGEMGLK